jgi:hypothetical protein
MFKKAVAMGLVEKLRNPFETAVVSVPFPS